MSVAGLSTASTLMGAKNIKLKESNYDKMLDQVGFNHLPDELNNKKEEINMKTIYHPANSRGHADHGWLDTNHTFSFAGYYNPERMNFGVLRVLNDDKVAAGRGFGTHPHDNMEIISIPIKGALKHQDSMGNTAIIKAGEVQIMSAGTGIMHSEYNESQNEDVEFLQIWMFPNKKNVTPRYDQISLDNQKNNEFYQVLSPNAEDEGVWAHQNAWFHLADIDGGSEIKYSLKDEKNGVYAFLIDGEVSIENQSMTKKDGMGIWDTDSFKVQATKNAKLLVMEVPMRM